MKIITPECNRSIIQCALPEALLCTCLLYTSQVIDATGVVDVFDVGNKPSCITYYGGRLWIATHNILFRSKMVAYYYDKKDDRLTSLSTYTIPCLLYTSKSIFVIELYAQYTLLKLTVVYDADVLDADAVEG